MTNRVLSKGLIVSLFAFSLTGCGGSGSGSTGGGGGGGGGGTGLSVSALSPSMVVVGVPQGQVTVLGQGFTQRSQVLIDGQPATQTTYTDSGTLQAEISTSLSATAGTHQFSVQNGGQTSNSLPFAVYVLEQGPFVMQAIPGFLVAENLSNAPFIVAADVNGDGLADVIMPGPGITNSESIAILNGQSDGTLSAPQYIPVPLTPYALAVGDVDANGTADLVSITSDNGVTGSTTVSVLFGDGHGNFQPPVTQQTFSAIYPGPVYLADLDGDGKPDLVLAVRQTGISVVTNLVWLKNTGGGFAAPVTLATLANYSFSIADFNSDGRPDVLYTIPNSSTTSESLHILMNQGNGTFTDQPAGGLNGIVGLTMVLDFNLDGIPDLIVQVQQGNSGILYSFAGSGNGVFSQVASLSEPGPIRQGRYSHQPSRRPSAINSAKRKSAVSATTVRARCKYSGVKVSVLMYCAYLTSNRGLRCSAARKAAVSQKAGFLKSIPNLSNSASNSSRVGMC